MRSRRTGRARALGLALALAVAAAGCGDEESSEETTAARLDEALAAHAEGRIDEAVEAYEEVLEEEAENQYALYNIGLIDQEAGRTADAEARYRAAVQADPAFAPALFNLAILRTEEDPDEASQLYRSVLALRPDDASAHLNLGFLLVQQGRASEGQVELDAAVELDPSLASRVPGSDADQPDAAPAEPDEEETSSTTTP